jgi:ubiquitin conjugation factor E4 B
VKESFCASIARDGRSFSPAHFLKACQILLTRGIKSQDDVDGIQSFVARCEQVLVDDAKAEEDLGDIPDDFLDPLMFTLMEDPVILPSSRVTVDRSTIQSHLLSDVTDPFNRSPLTMDMVLEDVAMKQRISEWKQQRGAK